MRPQRLVVLLAPVGLALTACGGAGAAADPGAGLPAATAAESITISAEAAVCGPAVSGGAALDCRIRVWYSNDSAAPTELDASWTRVVDGAGIVYRASAASGVALQRPVPARDRVSVEWTVSLPVGAVPGSITWLAPSGMPVTVPVVVASATPVPAPTPTPTRTPAPTASPTPTRATPAPRPKPSASRTSRPAPGPPASGSIG